jgi:hypothetical protein
MCIVPTLTFELLFAFLVLGHGRRQLLWFEVTRYPTAEWLDALASPSRFQSWLNCTINTSLTASLGG